VKCANDLLLLVKEGEALQGMMMMMIIITITVIIIIIIYCN